MNVTFRTIDPETDHLLTFGFYRETQIASHGTVIDNDAESYKQRLHEMTVLYPDGFVVVETVGHIIGHMELRVREYEGRDVGYVSVYYLVPEARGQGYSAELVRHAESFFARQGQTEYHLRVSPTNGRAVRFYEKHGMTKLVEETTRHGLLMWRMSKRLGRNI